MKTDEIKIILDSLSELVVRYGKDMRIKWLNKAVEQIHSLYNTPIIFLTEDFDKKNY